MIAASRPRVARQVFGALVGVGRTDLHLVALIADTVAVTAGRRAGVAVAIGAGRAVGLGRMVAHPRVRVARGIVGTLVRIRCAGLNLVILVADAVAVAARRRAGVAVGVGARRAVGLRRARARAGVLVARRVHALGDRARGAERDRGRLLARGRETVVTARVVGRRQVARRLLDLIGRPVGAHAEHLDVELEVAEARIHRRVRRDLERAARREDDLVRRRADGVIGGPRDAARRRDRRVALVFDDGTVVDARNPQGGVAVAVEVEPEPVERQQRAVLDAAGAEGQSDADGVAGQREGGPADVVDRDQAVAGGGAGDGRGEPGEDRRRREEPRDEPHVGSPCDGTIAGTVARWRLQPAARDCQGGHGRIFDLPSQTEVITCNVPWHFARYVQTPATARCVTPSMRRRRARSAHCCHRGARPSP